jgi:hypothetical protein
VALAAHAVGRVGAAQRDALVDGHIVTDVGRLADHGEAVVDEQVAADLRAGMNVDASQETGHVVDQAREEIHLRLEQPVRHPVPGHGPDARIEQHFPARSRRGIARDDGIQIGDQSSRHIL